MVLLDGSTRWAELRSRCPRMSKGTLGNRLKELERMGVVVRHVNAEARPPSVVYALTERLPREGGMASDALGLAEVLIALRRSKGAEDLVNALKQLGSCALLDDHADDIADMLWEILGRRLQETLSRRLGRPVSTLELMIHLLLSKGPTWLPRVVLPENISRILARQIHVAGGK